MLEKRNTKEVKLHDMYRYGNIKNKNRIVPVLRLEGDWLILVVKPGNKCSFMP